MIAGIEQIETHGPNVVLTWDEAKALDYEAYLKQVADIVKNLVNGTGGNTPPRLDTPGKRALFNNLGENEELALQIDAVVKNSRPDDWRGVESKERTIKAAMHAVLHDEETVERLFLIIKAQREY